MIALDVLYLKIYHMYLAKMYIETAIPKNIYVACVTHRAPHSIKASTISFYYKDLICSANDSPGCTLSEYTSHVLGRNVY
jgi:hypothetical protein